jgi:uncharacterized protein YlzI (FlbEa/FlbD family)
MIELTFNATGDQLRVDPAAIQVVRQFGGTTRISLTNGDTLAVVETVDEVCALMDEARSESRMETPETKVAGS